MLVDGPRFPAITPAPHRRSAGATRRRPFPVLFHGDMDGDMDRLRRPVHRSLPFRRHTYVVAEGAAPSAAVPTGQPSALARSSVVYVVTGGWREPSKLVGLFIPRLCGLERLLWRCPCRRSGTVALRGVAWLQITARVAASVAPYQPSIGAPPWEPPKGLLTTAAGRAPRRVLNSSVPFSGPGVPPIPKGLSLAMAPIQVLNGAAVLASRSKFSSVAPFARLPALAVVLWAA